MSRRFFENGELDLIFSRQLCLESIGIHRAVFGLRGSENLMHRHQRGRRLLAAGLALGTLLGATACATETTSPPSSVEQPVVPALDVEALKAELPANVRTSGSLEVATSSPFAPMEFRRGTDLVGFDVDLVTSIGRTLGLKVKFTEVEFPELISEVAAGKHDMGMRGLFDTKERERQVDMVTYLRAGTQWARRSGTDVDPYNACGKRVGAEAATTQLTVELPAKQRACEVVGRPGIDIVSYPTETAAMESLVSGRVDAVSADSPVTLYAANESGGKLEPAGHAFDTLPYAFPVRKGSALGKVLQKVVDHLISTGQLKTIAERWGLQRGVVKKSTINAAIN